MFRPVTSLCGAALFLRTAAGPCCGHQFYAGMEGRQTHPVAVQADGARLFVLNTPHARLAVFDITSAANPEPVLVAEIPVGLEPVSLRQRTPDELWVVNEASDSISIVSLSAGCVVETLPVPDEPADVVFAQGQAFVSCARNRLIRVFDPVTRMETGTIPLEGQMPRALALSADGARLFAACLLSGNGTTILPAAQAPPPPPPGNPALPPAPQTGLIVSSGDPRISWTVKDHDVAEINTADHALVRWHRGAGTNLFDLAVHPVTGDVWVTNTDARNLVRFAPNLRAHAVDHRLTRLTLPAGGVTVFDLNPGVDYGVLPNPAAQATALAQPAGLVWSPDGAFAWVAATGSDRIAKVAPDGTVVARVDVRPPGAGPRQMRGPRALALHPARPRLYVLNRVMNSVMVLDTQSLAMLAETGAGSRNPVPDYIREGRGFFYDARLSGNGTLSCASCHLDGDHDGLAWDLGDPGGEMGAAPGRNLAGGGSGTVVPRPMHPMKGPMRTKTLRSAIINSPYNWRGDHTLQMLSTNFVTKLGGSELPVADMQLLIEFMLSLLHPPNPHRALNNALPSSFNGGSAVTGQIRFNGAASRCALCHTGARGSNANIDDPALTSSTDYLKTAVLQTVYQHTDFTPGAGSTLSGFGLTHDGSGHALPFAHPYTSSALAADDVHVAAYLQCFDTGTLPVVGHSRTVTVANRGQGSLNAVLSTMEQQAATGRAELVARGRLEGRSQVFLADAFLGRWYGDRLADPGMTRAELLARLQPGDFLTFMGVPAQMGIVYSVDHNDNALHDGDEPLPAVSLSFSAGNVRLHGPNDTGWVPEWSPVLPAEWSTLTTRPQRTAESAVFPVPEGLHRGFFRLRRVW